MKYLIVLSIILASCTANKTPYVITEKSVYYREFDNMVIPIYEYTYYSGNKVRVYHYTREIYNVGDTLKQFTIKKASKKNHLLN